MMPCNKFYKKHFNVALRNRRCCTYVHALPNDECTAISVWHLYWKKEDVRNNKKLNYIMEVEVNSLWNVKSIVWYESSDRWADKNGIFIDCYRCDKKEFYWKVARVMKLHSVSGVRWGRIKLWRYFDPFVMKMRCKINI
jgi:hypothetical protein